MRNYLQLTAERLTWSCNYAYISPLNCMNQTDALGCLVKYHFTPFNAQTLSSQVRGTPAGQAPMNEHYMCRGGQGGAPHRLNLFCRQQNKSAMKDRPFIKTTP